MEEHLFIKGHVGGKDLDAIRLADLQVKRDAGDRVLIDTLIDCVSAAISRESVQYEMPDTFNLPEHCTLWQWLDVYLKAIQHLEFVSWASRQHLDLKTLRVQGGTLYVNEVKKGITTPRVIDLHDDSGWWQVADPITAVVQIIDPAGIDKLGIRDPSAPSTQVFSLGATLAFYGYPLPVNRPQAHVMVDELRLLSGFPVIDSSGFISTSLSVEQTQQVKDCAKMASELEKALQEQLASRGEYDFLETYRKRIKLDSGSMLAQTMNSALRVLQRLSIKLNVGKTSPPTGYYYSRISRTVMEIDRLSIPRAVTADRLSAPEVASDLAQLAAHGEKLGSDVHADGCFTLAFLLQAYGQETPADATQVRALISALTQPPIAPMPYVHASAHSAAALLRHRRYLGLLNNRFAMSFDLLVLARDQVDSATITAAGRTVTLDPDSPLSELAEVGCNELLAIMALDEFKAIQTTMQLDPAGHVLVGASGYVGARTLGGGWVDLEAKVKTVAVLASKFEFLATMAGRMGGSLRSNGEVTLEQMLKFYGFEPPVTAQAARTLALRLHAVPLRPRPSVEYWNALGGTFASVSSPLLSRRLQIIEEPEHFMPRIGTSLYYWAALQRVEVTVVLSPSQRQQVRDATVQFMVGKSGGVFDYLVQPLVAGRSTEGLRAEADLLISQMLASPRAQILADALAGAVTWQGEQARYAATRAGRHSLVLAAAILSLDPQAGASRNRIAGIDLAAEPFWGDSYGNLLAVFEARLVSDHRLDTHSAPLAAHLLLSGVAPEFLVRDIPRGLAYMSGQLWLHFKHCVTYLEGRYPGSARRLAFDSIMSGDRLKSIKPAYWNLKEFSGPVIDWARANGLLPERAEAFKPEEFAKAKKAVLGQLDDLQAAISSFHRVAVTRRELALADLRRVYPGNDALQAQVLEPDADQASSGPMASLVDLHLAGRLTPGSSPWRSTADTLDFPAMAEDFPALDDVNRRYGERFIARDSELWTAHVQALRYSLSLMTLNHRKRLEYGTLTLFFVSQSQAGAVTRGRFGILVLCQHPAFADCAYEFFPRQLLIVERTDLTVRQLMAEDGATPPGPQTVPLPTLLPLDWAAYEQGGMPRPGVTSRVILEQFAQVAAVANQALADADALSVPATMNSFRISNLASSVLGNSLFEKSLGLRLSAGDALTLDDAINGRDPWSEYQQGMTGQEAVQV